MCVCDRIPNPPCFYCGPLGARSIEERRRRVREGIARSLNRQKEKTTEAELEKERLRLRRRRGR